MADQIEKLAFMLDDLHTGGVQKTTLLLATGFAQLGHEVHIVVLKDEGDLKEGLHQDLHLHPIPAGKRVPSRLAALQADPLGLFTMLRPLLLPRYGWWAMNHLSGLSAYLASERPDWLISATPPLNIVADLANRLSRAGSTRGRRTRIAMTERTAPSMAWEGELEWRKRFLPSMMRRCYTRADAVISVSNALADDLAAFAAMPRAKIEVIYNPLIGPDFNVRLGERNAHAWFNGDAVPVLLAAGRFSEQKDFRTLVRAFALVRQNRPVRLVILGGASNPVRDQERRNELKDLANELGVGGDIDMPGLVENPLPFMRDAACYILSSRYEGLPGVLVQAMGAGCPVVATDCPTGPREVLDDGKLGTLVGVGDHAAMARAVLDTLDNPAPTALLTARAQDFTFEKSLAAYHQRLLDRPIPA